MRAVKSNREYMIEPTQKNDYVKRGFDILDDSGTILQAGAGKTVLYEKYHMLEDENLALKKETAALKKETAALKKKLAEGPSLPRSEQCVSNPRRI